MDIGYHAENSNLTLIPHSLPSKASPGSCKPSIDLEFITADRESLPEQLLSRWGDGFLVLPTLSSSSANDSFPLFISFKYI